jgi:large subunit ribosomal protein L4
VVFAPKPRTYKKSVNKKIKALAMKSALSSKVADNNLLVLDAIAFDEIKTKNFANVMSNLKVNKGLVVIAENDANVVLSARNMADVNTTLVNTMNVYDVMKANTVVLTKDAVAKIEEVYA